MSATIPAMPADAPDGRITPGKKLPWLVRVHHRMRATSFATLFAATCLHIGGQGYGVGAWLFFGALFLVYPHLQYWRARRADNSVDAELGNLLVDSALLGLAVAILEFPLWIAFSALLGTLTNNATNNGWRGVGQSLLAALGGALAWIAIGGFQFSPATSWPTTLFCIVCLSVYLLVIGNIGFARNRQLRQTRGKLQLREKELLSANETLLAKLKKIDELQRQLREQANRDPLTGLYNRRYLDATLERELSRCARQRQTLALVLIDIDHFKRINDNYGHQAGDEVLVRLGALLGESARAGDVVCRYGGEEFLLLMPGMSIDTARERAEQLRAAFGALLMPFNRFQLRATLSIGVAAYPEQGETADQLIGCADRALYRARHGGRDRVAG